MQMRASPYNSKLLSEYHMHAKEQRMGPCIYMSNFLTIDISHIFLERGHEANGGQSRRVHSEGG
jgi:hypothetical protein